ncbi:MAG: PQQ-binding-like beta-propeller repeat protein, partial [Candidatus Spechtbacterales bacterium]
DNNFADFTVATSTTPKNSNGETYVLPPPPSNPIWAMYQKDARHSGLATLSGPTWTSSSQATTTWVFEMKQGQDLDGARSQAVVGSDGVVYVTSALGNVYAINPDGIQKWQFEPSKSTDGGDGAGWAGASPALSATSSVLYSVHTDTQSIPNKTILYAIQTSDKTRLWKFSINSNDGFTSPVLDSAGNIYIASASKLYSISQSGILRAGFPFTPTSQFSSSAIWIRTPAIAKEGANEHIYITAQMSNNSGDRYIFKVDVSNGNEIWKSNADMSNALFNGVSVNATGTIYTGGYLNIGTSGLFAISPADGSKIWSNNIGDVSGSVPNFDIGGKVYIGTVTTQNSGAFNKVNATSTLLWSFVPDEPSAVQHPAVIDSQGRVYVGAKNKLIYALNPSGGAIIWKYELSDYAVGFAIGNGRVYVVGYDGKVYMFGQ